LAVGTGRLDLAHVKVPAHLHERLSTAAGETSITRLKKAIGELEALGPECVPLAEALRQALREYDMERIQALLGALKPV
jgi:hypothetical protein